MSILWYVNIYTNIALSVTRINNSIFNGAVQNGFMDSRCYMMDPTGFARWLGWDAMYTGKHEKPTYQCKENEVEILRWEVKDKGKTWSHFTAGVDGICTYDPWYHERGGSVAVAKGEVVSKRIFRY